jgi:hypothetical protein
VLKSYLKELGATEVVDESESAMFGDTMSKLFKVRTNHHAMCYSQGMSSRDLVHLLPQT